MKQKDAPPIMSQSAEKPQRFKITLSLDTGAKHVVRVKEEPKKLLQVMDLIANNWMNKHDGYVVFNGNIFKISAIIHYKFKKAWF
jgi:hypothetical protein